MSSSRAGTGKGDVVKYVAGSMVTGGAVHQKELLRRRWRACRRRVADEHLAGGMRDDVTQRTTVQPAPEKPAPRALAKDDTLASLRCLHDSRTQVARLDHHGRQRSLVAVG